eukprot:scaffold408_cov71-Cylindrotheca_fusiformis.AAC.15
MMINFTQPTTQRGGGTSPRRIISDIIPTRRRKAQSHNTQRPSSSSLSSYCRARSNRRIMSANIVLFLMMLFFLPCLLVAQDRFEQVQLRVYESVDRFLDTPLVASTVFRDFYNLRSFPNDLKASDRDTFAQKYLYSLVLALNFTGLKPYYGLEDGTFLGYLHADTTQVPRLVYREPGNSGYLFDDPELGKYWNTCVNPITGTPRPCELSTESNTTFISCINDCELISCPSSSDDNFCNNYEILSLDNQKNQTELGYIPMSTYCIDRFGGFSQEPGSVLTQESGVLTNEGTCTFLDGITPVERNITGPFANCQPGNDANDVCSITTNETDVRICNNTFAGAYESTNYDPRWRKWYIDCRTMQVPRFSDPYVFFTTGIFGLTYTYPLYKLDEMQGLNVFEGVVAVDMELDDVSAFLRQSFDQTMYTAAIYEDREPHKMIGVSTGSSVVEWVQIADPTTVCTEEETQRTFPRVCIARQLTINNFEESLPDTILRKAHEALSLTNFSNNTSVAVRDDEDDVASQSYLANSIVYEKPGENLKWRIVVTRPIDSDPEDSITVGEGSYILMFIIGGLGFTLCCLLFWAFYLRRNEELVQYADFQFTSAFLLGAACLNLSTFTLVGETTDELCVLRMWVFFMLSSMMISPLFIKAYRTYKLLGSSVASAMSVKMDNGEAWLRALPIPLVQMIVLFIFTYADPWKATAEINLDSAIPTKIMLCRSSTTGFVIVQSIFDFLLLFMGCVLAYLTRKVDPLFCDAKALLFAMYNIAFTTLMVALVLGTIDTHETGKHVLQAIGVFWGTVFSSAGFVLPRLFAAKKERRRKKKDIRTMRTTLENKRRQNRATLVTSSIDYLHEDEDALKILVCSANLGNAEPTPESMKSLIPEYGECSHVSTIHGNKIDAEQFDLIVIGLQEATWVRGSKKSAIKRTSSAPPVSDPNGPRGKRGSLFSSFHRRSSMSSGHLALEESRFRQDAYMAAVEGADTVTLRRVIRLILGNSYTNIAEEQRGQMRLTIWALKDVAPGIRDIKVSGANTGVGNVLANKGGIVTSMVFHDTRLSFLSAHLAAHEGERFYQARCNNMVDILKHSKTCDLNTKHSIDMAITSHHMFVLGDLNFRTAFDIGREMTHEEKFSRAKSLIESKDWLTLYSFDELYKAIAKGDVLFNFSTLPCNFSPTFKVNRVAGFDYMDHRVPSYTDRIVVKSAPGLSSNLRPLSYDPCVDFVTSDHKPIRGAFSIVPNDMISSTTIEGRYRLVFSEMECSDLIMGNSESCNPFIMFVWDSVEMCEDGKAHLAFLKRNKVFPRTSTKYKSQNPKWKKHYSLVTTSEEIKIGASLYLCVYGHERVGDGSILGTLALNMQNLLRCQPDETTKELVMDKPLERYGKKGGRIKFKVEISMLVG